LTKTGAQLIMNKNDVALLGKTCKNTAVDIFAEDNDIIDIGGIKLKVIHTPGHSPGGICLWCDGHLFAGDTLFYENVGRCDLEGGSFTAIIHSVKEKLFTLPDDTRVYPGHGEYTTIGHEKKYNPYVGA